MEILSWQQLHFHKFRVCMRCTWTVVMKREEREEGREEGREGGREAGREGGREEGKEGGRMNGVKRPGGGRVYSKLKQ